MERYVSCLDFGLNGKLASFERDAFIAKMCHRTGLYSLSFSNTRLCRCFWRIAPMHCSPHEKKKKKKRKARLLRSSSFWTWRPVLQRNPQPVYNELTEEKVHSSNRVLQTCDLTHTHKTKERQLIWASRTDKSPTNSKRAWRQAGTISRDAESLLTNNFSSGTVPKIPAIFRRNPLKKRDS